MNYCFSVNMIQTKDRKVHWTDYNRIWDDFIDNNLIVLYKVQHEADEECPHTHYHGLLQSNGTFNYKQLERPEYSYKFEICKNYEKWFSYCLHEINSEKEKVRKQLEDIHEKQIYNNVMNAITYKRPKQGHIKLKKKADNTFTIKLY